ncbi:MAG: bifunctional phosphopantothenoylcysteine decarboxylase/phosphopantothenate--cysteine ligase CoaBC [Thermosulfidibacteraceae bacterium]|jgi:phosphopantothenoylcysteine decarboxylase/phosphopantothenate--cysteine ligase
MRLKGRRIALGITGGISIYKVCEVVRLLVKSGIEVNVIMTKDATRFINPELFRSLSRKEVLVDVFEYSSPDRIEHVDLASNIDLLVIAPLTANTLAKIANGIADNMLSCLFLAYAGKTLLFPAMNTNMYMHPVTQKNLEYLKSIGCVVVEPKEGSLACLAEGKGRLPEPEEIFEEIIYHLSDKDFEGKRVLVTAGPTREHIDPVRFITNASSGKMGYSIARALSNRGAEVTLVSGPVNLKAPTKVKLIRVISAQEMFEKTIENFEKTDIFVLSAAVADYRPKETREKKIKKEKEELKIIELIENPDIAKTIGKMKKDNQILVGFAAETENLVENAMRKMKEKNMDMIVANIVEESMERDIAKITIINKRREVRVYPELSKEEIADIIADEIKKLIS